MLSASAGSLALERDGATGRYRVLSGGFALAEIGRSAVLAAPDGSVEKVGVAPDQKRVGPASGNLEYG